MLRIAVCEDNPETQELLTSILENTGFADADLFGSGDALLSCLNAGGDPYHIYLLDIEMPGRSGIETASAIRGNDPEALLIFITDHKDYVYEVFEVLPFRFLRKPVTEETVAKALRDAEDHINAAKKLFFYHIGHERHQLPCGAIRYFEGAGRRVVLHTAGGKEVTYYGKISDVPGKVDQTRFCQVHASYIVNLEYVRSVLRSDILMNDDKVLPVSRKYSASVHEAHRRFVYRKGGMR